MILSPGRASRSTAHMVKRILDLAGALRDMHAAAGHADRANQLASLASQATTQGEDRRSRIERGWNAIVVPARRPVTHQQRTPDREDHSRDDAAY